MNELEVEFVLANDAGIEAEFILESEVGTTDHNELINRDMENQHPISAITGLQDELDSKQSKLISGSFIHIDSNNMITTTYTAGNGININSNGVISTTASIPENLPYNNWRVPEVSNVKEGLDAALYYNSTDLTITSDSIFEVGSKVTTLTFNWDKPNESAVTKIEPYVGQVIKNPPYTHTFTTPVTTDTTFKISIYQLGNPEDSITGTASIKFLPKIYWGSSYLDPSNEDILRYNSRLSDSRNAVGEQSLTVNCESGKYVYIVIPSSYIDDTIRIRIGGLNCSDYEVSMIELENEQGFIQEYTLYKINNLQHTQLIDVEIL